MFETDENGNTLPNRFVEEVNVEWFNLKPNFDLREVDMQNYSNDDETGYIKMELISQKSDLDLHPILPFTVNRLRKPLKIPQRQAISIVTPNEPYFLLQKIFL